MLLTTSTWQCHRLISCSHTRMNPMALENLINYLHTLCNEHLAPTTSSLLLFTRIIVCCCSVLHCTFKPESRPRSENSVELDQASYIDQSSRRTEALKDTCMNSKDDDIWSSLKSSGAGNKRSHSVAKAFCLYCTAQFFILYCVH